MYGGKIDFVKLSNLKMAQPEVKSLISEGVIEEILKLHFTNTPKPRLAKEVPKVMAEVSAAFVTELLGRANNQASLEGSQSISLEHVEKILPQLVISNEQH